VLFGVWTVALTARLGRRVAGPEAGRAAALLLALSPLHIAWSQVVRSDIIGTAFVVLALLGAFDVMAGRGRVIRCALYCALAIASKWPFAIVALAVPAALVWCWHTRRITGPAALRMGARFAAAVPVLLILIAPYLLIAHAAVLRDLAGEAQVHHLGATGASPLANAWWYGSGPLVAAFGIAGIGLAGLGLWVLRRVPECRVILLPVLIAFLSTFSCQHLVWDRWMLPLLPGIAVLSGCGLVWLQRAAACSLGRPAAMVLITAAASLPLILADVAAARERADNTAQQATRWAIAHIPAGSTVLVEHFAFDLLPQPWHLLFPFGDVGCVDPRTALTGKIDHHAISAGRGSRSNVDYGTVAPARRQTCRADYAILTQLDRYQAEQDTFPAEYAAYRDYVSAGRVVATFRPIRGQSGGRIVQIVAFDRR
jgi:4-amino-4-deoxy-L-arabinose transferase-like glycosyltransferase